MKATGIVRRIDDLGRIVIPKEIRRAMKIREGDPLEIYTDKDGSIIFRKYSLMEQVMEDTAKAVAQVLYNTIKDPNVIAIITDRDKVIAATYGMFVGHMLSNGLFEDITNGFITPENNDLASGFVIYRRAFPIQVEGEIIGSICLAYRESDTNRCFEVCKDLEQSVSLLTQTMCLLAE